MSKDPWRRPVLLLLLLVTLSLDSACTAPVSPMDAGTCAPACRPGFACVRGTCVSACNPACRTGETCTSDLRCIADSDGGTVADVVDVGPVDTLDAISVDVADAIPVDMAVADASAEDASDAPSTDAPTEVMCPGGRTLCGSTCVATSTDTANCGSCGNVCVAPLHGMSACGAGVCEVICDAGYLRMGSSCVPGSVSAPRLLAPVSSSVTTSRRPTLNWVLAPGTTGVRVQLCADRACGTVLGMFDSTALRGTPPTDLPPGVTFWNARSLVSGSPAGPSSATWQFTVPRASAAIDTYWGSVLDVNGDGHADAVIGAPTTASRGRMLVFLGSSTGLPLAPSTTTDAVTATGTYASAVGSAGDVNGDGFTDVIIGALGESGGRAYVFYGSAGGLGTAPTMLIGPSGGQFGASVAGAGDVNGDGYADVIVGAPQAVSPQGRAYVFLGGPGGISLTASVTLAGPDTGDFGISVSTAGDTNGDRFADVVVGAQTAPGGGRAYVYRGNAGGLFAGFATLISPSGTGVGSFGYTVATAGDMNGDGLTEVIVGGYRGDAHVYRGNAAGVGSPPFASYPAPVGSTQFAWVVAPAFDVNGDGLDDVIVGDNDADTQAGRAHVYLGARTGPLPTVPATSINGPDGPGGRFGAALGGGDVDRDGFSDILVGSPRANLRAGRVRLFAGSAAGLSVTATSVLSGALAGDAFGSAIGH